MSDKPEAKVLYRNWSTNITEGVLVQDWVELRDLLRDEAGFTQTEEIPFGCSGSLTRVLKNCNASILYTFLLSSEHHANQFLIEGDNYQHLLRLVTKINEFYRRKQEYYGRETTTLSEGTEPEPQQDL